MKDLRRVKLAEKEGMAIGELVKGLKNLYKDNLIQLILYGSKARGDAEDGSDIDILVVLKNMNSSFEEIQRIIEISAPICLEYDLVLEAMPEKEETVNASYKNIFVYNVLKEGVGIPI